MPFWPRLQHAGRARIAARSRSRIIPFSVPAAQTAAQVYVPITGFINLQITSSQMTDREVRQAVGHVYYEPQAVL